MLGTCPSGVVKNRHGKDGGDGYEGPAEAKQHTPTMVISSPVIMHFYKPQMYVVAPHHAVFDSVDRRPA